jgi:hypothetical protein
MEQQRQRADLSEQERLFLSLVEQLSQPLMQIARVSEVAVEQPQASTADWRVVRTVAEASLQLVESYALSLRVHGRVTPLSIEPISVSSLLYDTAHALQPYAHQYGVALELEPGPKMQPILADRTILQAALTSLGQVFVLAQSESDEAAVPVRLSAHRGRYGVVAGVYGPTVIGADSLHRARQQYGAARQPLQQLVSGPAAGVFVADSLLHALSTRLHAARYHNITGLAATLQPSQQLQLV